MSELTELEKIIASLSENDIKELDRLLEPELSQKFLPIPGPQSDAYYSEADIMLFGGAASGGKSFLIAGLAYMEHERTVIFRRQYSDLVPISDQLLNIVGNRNGFNASTLMYRNEGKLIEFGAFEKPNAELRWQGNPHDLICFDEAAQMSEEKVKFVMGWNRTTTPGQRCRIVLCSNPPIGGSGDWLIKWFEPWLSNLYPNPAKPGELRWAINVGNELIWVESSEKVTIEGKSYTPKSRTFIPSKIENNPYINDDYRATLENLPEPLRSQLLYGDFLSGREDHEFQVIPTSWIEAANKRWEDTDKINKQKMIAISSDVALGGGDSTVISRLYENCFFGELISRDDSKVEDKASLPKQISLTILEHRKDEADISIDCTGGFGSGIRSHLTTDNGIDAFPIVFSEGSNLKTKDGKLGFKNKRAEIYWKFREALDPEFGDNIKLPPDARLKAELSTPRYELRGTDIKIEDKKEIKKRVGSSPDRADAIVMAWSRKGASIKKPIKLNMSGVRSAFPSGNDRRF